MNMTAILEAVWAALNSPAGITAVAGLILWALNRLYARKPAWKAYEGTIISGIKFAEKRIPDDTENKSLNRLDHALRYVLKAYEEINGKRASEKTAAELKEGIQVKHADLESSGAL